MNQGVLPGSKVDETEAVVFQRYRDADDAIQHSANTSHLMEPIMATATVTREVLGTLNAKMRQQLEKRCPKVFTPWMAMEPELSDAWRSATRFGASPHERA